MRPRAAAASAHAASACPSGSMEAASPACPDMRHPPIRLGHAASACTAPSPVRTLLAALLSASLMVSGPEALAEPATLPRIALPSATESRPTFQAASVDFAASLVPLVGSLKAQPAAPLASKAVALAVTGDPKEIMRTIDSGLDAFLSVPPERFYAAAVALKQGTALAAQAPSCNLVCLPPPEETAKVARVAGDALSMTDPTKLKAFVFQGGMSLMSGEKAQYAGVLGEAVKFSFSLDRQDVIRAKDAGVSLLLAADNPDNARPPTPMPRAQAFPKSAALEQAALGLAVLWKQAG